LPTSWLLAGSPRLVAGVASCDGDGKWRLMVANVSFTCFSVWASLRALNSWRVSRNLDEEPPGGRGRCRV
jgi:hypothetical protein